MIPKYVPIVKAKQGEFDAYNHLEDISKKKILPLFELPKFTQSTNERVAYKDKANPIECYLCDLTNNISSARGSLPTMVDIFTWSPNSTLENGEHILNFSINRLVQLGVPVIPVIGYDRWEDTEYSNALLHIDNTHGKFALRLESYAFEDMIDEDHFFECIDDIIDSVGMDPNLCNVILDFSDVTKSSVVDIQEKITKAVFLLSKYNFKFISIAGCSITAVVNDMVPSVDSTGIVLRREMVAWQACRSLIKSNNLIFGDYGIASPNAAEGVIAPDANGKIRYTIKNNYFVVRGHSRRQGNKGAQMYELSKLVTDSKHYMGMSYSWGDKRIMNCSNKEFKGNLMNWISIDLNHHIQAVLSEIFEFERVIHREIIESSL